MEKIILLFLFTYPGSFAEFTYSHFAKDRVFYREPDTIFRTARGFFLSAIITYLCLVIYGKIIGASVDLPGVIKHLSVGKYLFPYALGTLIASILAGVLWYAGACAVEALQNRYRAKHDKPRAGRSKQVWMAMIADPNTPQTDYAVEIRKNGQLVRCGLAYHMPDDLRVDTGFALVHCATVAEYIDNAEYDLIGPPLIHYIDLEHDAEIILRDATKLCDWLEGKAK